MLRRSARGAWVLLASVLATASPALGFETGNFRSGMGKDAALVEARRLGWSPVQIQQSAAFETWMNNKGTGTLAFCSGRLWWVSDVIGDGLEAFVRLVARESEVRGEASVRASTAETNIGTLYTLVARWPAGAGESYMLTLRSSPRNAEVEAASEARDAICR